MKKKLMLVATIVLASTISNATTPKIHVGVVFSSDFNPSIPYRVSLVSEWEDDANDVFRDSGMPGRFVFTPRYFPNMNYVAANKTTQQAVSWMHAQNAIVGSDFRTYRDAGAFPDYQGADIMIMITPAFSDTNCALAGLKANSTDYMPPRNISAAYSEDKAFIAMEDDQDNCPSTKLVAHELGHVLYAEHEDVKDNNGDINRPASSNHGVKIFSQGENTESIMASGTNTDGLTFKFSGSEPDITSFYSDVKDFITNSSWEKVSKYRGPRPGPTSCTNPIFLGCHSQGCGDWLMSFSAQDAATYQIESRRSGGPWIPRTNTEDPFYAPHLGEIPQQWRIRGANSLGQVGDSCVFWTSGQCGSQGGGNPF